MLRFATAAVCLPQGLVRFVEAARLPRAGRARRLTRSAGWLRTEGSRILSGVPAVRLLTHPTLVHSTLLADQLSAALGGAYTIERELGGGGMSRVFVALDERCERRVAVKVLPEHLAASVSVDRFKREILLSAGLQHPHIVGVLSAGDAAGLPYFVMPYVEGETLGARLARTGALPVREAVSILKDVARALAYAHERGVVHRDIKPHNILLAAGAATVTDFGVAKALSSARRSGGGARRHAHRCRHVARHAAVHGAGAGGGRSGHRSPRRHLRASA